MSVSFTINEISQINPGTSDEKKWIRILLLCLLGIICIYPLHSVLSLNEPVDTEMLVVEGWIHHEYFDQVAEAFNNGNYQQIVTTGAYISASETGTCFSSFPQRAAELLKKRDIAEDKIIQLPWKDFHDTKTYSSFLPLKDWLQNQNTDIKAINLYTASVYARKSYHLCKRALGKQIKIGVIAGPTLEYNPRFRVISRRGIWLVFKNTSSLIVDIFQK